MVSTVFPAKILLFGEYTALLGSKALAIPYPHFSGSLKMFNSNVNKVDENKLSSNKILKSFFNYIHNTIRETELSEIIETERFESELKSGIFFRSDIPNGCGLGSSGALTAAIYHRYFNYTNLDITTNLTAIQKHLGYLESFFHKTSSGIDPLVSFCNYPLLLQNEVIVKVEIPQTIQNQYTLDLFDTQIKRTTANLVEDFLRNCNKKGFLSLIQNELIIANNLCIEAIMEDNVDKLFYHLKFLSNFQYIHFKSLIPISVLPLWEKGLKTGNYYKLCGAGGGGYLLRFTRKDKQL